MTAFPLDQADPAKLAAVAERARRSRDVALPPLPVLNTDPCAEHESPQSWCRACGLSSRRHQRVAGVWLYFVRKGLLADPCGSGKTASATIALAMAFQAGELNTRRGGGRAVVICRAPVTGQWSEELARFTPGIRTAVATGTPRHRADRYAEPWDVLIIGQQNFVRDKAIIGRLGIKHLVVDDIDPIRHSETQTAWAVKELALSCQRVMLLSATPLQKRLEELYDLFGVIGGKQVLGGKAAFQRRYVRTSPSKIYTANPNRGQLVGGVIDQRPTVARVVRETSGYRNLGEFKALIAPMVLRRPFDDLDDLDMPALESHNVFLELYPSQRARYKELQDGVARFVREHGTETKAVTAMAKLIYGSQICESLAALDDGAGPDTSVKFDWILDRLTGDWSPDEDAVPEKIVVFVQYKNGVRALQRRLVADAVDHVTVWGEERGPDRDAAIARFRADPGCRVLIGTTAIEQSINLQVARHLVNVDQIINPARMTQLAGRIRRDGSRFRTVYVHNLMATDTHEERILRTLQNEAALTGAVWNEAESLYASLSPVQMMQLIAPDSRPAPSAA